MGLGSGGRVHGVSPGFHTRGRATADGNPSIPSNVLHPGQIDHDLSICCRSSSFLTRRSEELRRIFAVQVRPRERVPRPRAIYGPTQGTRA